MDNKPKRPYRKLEQNKTYHLELLFDTPFATEKEFNGRILKGYKYAFRDIETGEEFTCIISQTAKTAAPLLEKKRGDQFDLTLATYEMNGQLRKGYRITPLWQTPVPAGKSSIQPPQPQQTYTPPVQQNTGSQAVSIDDIDF
jgi:hypothetical protein